MHMKPIALTILAALAIAAPAAAEPRLLIDDRHIQTSHGLTRVIEQPRVHPHPIITGTEGNFTPYLSVLHENGRYRLWHNAITGVDGDRYIRHLESRNGIDFTDARRVDFPAPASYGASVIPAPGGYMLAWSGTPQPHQDAVHAGVRFALSQDGVTGWRTLNPAPLYPVVDVGYRAAAGDIISVVRHRGRYLAFVKMHTVAEDGYLGMTPNTPFPGYRRIVGVMDSPDGVAWSAPRRIIVPDSLDAGVTEFYGLGGVVERDGMLVGFLRVLRDDIGLGMGYTVLAWSRDGVTWQRDRQPFLDRKPGSFYGAMAWADAQVTAGARTLVYFGGYDAGHKENVYTGRSLGVASMLRDRYVARAGSGELVTRAFRYGGGGGVFVNARVGGSLTASVGGVRCVAPRQDRVVVRLRCERPLRGGVGRVVFRLRDASLYSFEVR